MSLEKTALPATRERGANRSVINARREGADMRISRRAFLETTALGSMAAGPLAGAGTKIPTHVLGKTGARVSILAMGGGSRFLLYKAMPCKPTTWT
jgi:hypothetical protein